MSTTLDLDRDSHGKPIIPLDNLSVYQYGKLIRETERKILDLFGKGLLSGTTHTCLGQELCQMSVVRALTDPDDAILSNHRNHGHYVTYSGDSLGLIAEIMGRKAGVCGGYGGSQHIAYRHFHSNGVQGGMTAIAVGLAKARQLDNSNGIVSVIIGDGTLGEGLLYEAMNLASIWKLPVLFVVENNGIAQTTYTDTVIGGEIVDRGKAFGLQTWALDDANHDFLAQVEGVVGSVRTSKSPGLLSIITGRLGPHSKGDDLRSEDEKKALAERDPLQKIGAKLTVEDREKVDEAIFAFLSEVEDIALASPVAQLEMVPDHLFGSSSGDYALNTKLAAGTATNVRSQINFALDQILESNQRAIIIGEDLHDPYGGAFKVTADLSSKYQGRVISTPISEAGITGAAIGLALAGYRPIVEIMFADFMTLCLDQIYNHAVKFPGMFEDCSVPMIIRTPCGGRRGYGPTHSQSIENLFLTVPGLTVVYPSHRHPVGDMLTNISMYWDHPVLFLEHKLLYGETCQQLNYESMKHADDTVGGELFPILRTGSNTPDLTIVTYGGMLPEVELAVAQLEQQEELEIEIVVPSLLSPMPADTLISHLSDRNAILIAEESHSMCGFGSEVSALLAESNYRGEVARLGTNPIPIAAARSIEKQILPDQHDVFHSAMDLLS